MSRNTFNIFKKLGGPDRAHKALGGDRKIKFDSLRKWEARGSMPSWAVLDLMAFCKMQKISYDPDDFRLAAENETAA